MVQYYKACKRELWFYANQLNMNYDDDNINIGKLIHETAYSDERKNILIDGEIAVDFVKDKDGAAIFEVKKSSRLEEPTKYQLYYYMWYLKNKKGMDVKGMLVYPNEKKREELVLTPEIEMEMEGIVADIPNIANLKTPPKAEKKRYCRRCSYFEFCRV